MFPAAIAVAQAAIGLIGIFSSGPPSLPDLLSIQMEVLKKVSAQIAAVNGKLDLLFGQLAEIQKLLEELPDEVVAKLSNSLVRGAFNRQRELLSAYTLEVSRHGLVEAQRVLSSHFEQEVLVRIREARDDLFDRRVEYTIPILARALQVEVQTMILLRYPSSLILSALASYKEWFVGWGEEANQWAFPAQMKVLIPEAQKLAADLKGKPWSCYRLISTTGNLDFHETTTVDESRFFLDQTNLTENETIRLACFELPRLNGPCPCELPGAAPFATVLQQHINELTISVAAKRDKLLTNSSLGFVAGQSAMYCDQFGNSAALNGPGN